MDASEMSMERDMDASAISMERDRPHKRSNAIQNKPKTPPDEDDNGSATWY
jgi:hypothetical protein